MADAVLQLEIQDNSAKAAQGLNQLAASLEKIKGAVSGASQLGTLAQQIEKITSAVSTAIPEESISRIERLADALERLSGVGAINIKMSNGARRYMENITQPDAEKPIQSPVQQVESTTQAAESTGRLRSLIAGLRETMSGARGTVSSFSEGMSALNASLRNLESSLQPVVSALGSLGKGILKVAGAGVRGAVAGIRQVAGVFGKLRYSLKLSNTAFGKLFSSIKRVAMYRLIRSAIKAVTDGVKTGVENLYQYSKAMNGSFAKAMDSGSSASLKFKNSIGAMLGPAIQAVIPLLISLANAAITAANAINQVLAVLSGASVWTRATDVFNSAEKAAKGAGSAAKNLLADWDELNIIQSQAGGGGGGAADSFSSMFTTEDLPENEWTKVAKRFKEAIENGDWYGAGKILADKINSLVSQLQPSEWAYKLNDYLKSGLSLAVGLLNETDFQEIGSKIGAFLLGIFGANNQVNWELIGAFLRLRIMGVISTIKGLFETPGLVTGIAQSAANLVNSFFDFNEEQIETIKSTVNGVIGKSLSGIITFLDTVKWEEIGEKVKAVLSGIDWEDHLKKVWEVIKRAAKAVFVITESFFTGIFEGIGLKLYNAIAGIINNIGASINPKLDHIAPKFGSSGAFDEWFQSGHTGALRDFNGLFYLRDEYLDLIAAQEEFNRKLAEGTVTADEAKEALMKGFISQEDYDLIPEYKITDATSGLLRMIQAWNDLGKIDIKQWSELSEAIHDGRITSVDELEAWAKDLGAEIDDVVNVATRDIDPDEAARILGLTEENVEEAVEKASQIAATATPTINVEPVVVDSGSQVLTDTFVYEAESDTVAPVELRIQPFAEVESRYVDDLYGMIYDAINDYSPDTSDLDADEFWDDTLRPLVDSVGNAAGLTQGATNVIADELYEKWIQSLYDESWEGSVAGLLAILQEAVDSAIPDELKTPDTASYESAISGASATTVNAANSAIAALGRWAAMAGALNSFSMPRVNFPSGNIRFAASGGVMTAGQMFIAREAGPEFVGTIGGHTAVANNDQIVSGITSGVAAGQVEQNALLRQQNDYLRQLLNKELTLRPSSALARVNQRSAEMYERQTGRG